MPTNNMPAWASDLSEKYYSGVTSMFVLHGNVRDLAPRTTEFVPLSQFLREALFGARDLVLFYDRGGGLTFSTPEMKADFTRALAGYDSFHGTNFSNGLPRNPDGVLNILDNYLRLRIQDKRKSPWRSISPRPWCPPATRPACPPKTATAW